jgi:hypothetical protein
LGLGKTGRGTQVKAAILIIGEDGVLSYTRAQILKDCRETATAKAADAQVALHARPYDLLVFSQTVPDAAVKEIMASAMKPPGGDIHAYFGRGTTTTVRLRHVDV